jgi:hypothetical protein
MISKKYVLKLHNWGVISLVVFKLSPLKNYILRYIIKHTMRLSWPVRLRCIVGADGLGELSPCTVCRLDLRRG